MTGVLHTLFRSPGHCEYSLLLRAIQQNDAVLLLQDGVLAAMAGSRAWIDLERRTTRIFALNDDLAARGLANFVPSSVIKIDYAGFVVMTLQYTRQISW